MPPQHALCTPIKSVVVKSILFYHCFVILFYKNRRPNRRAIFVLGAGLHSIATFHHSRSNKPLASAFTQSILESPSTHAMYGRCSADDEVDNLFRPKSTLCAVTLSIIKRHDLHMTRLLINSRPAPKRHTTFESKPTGSELKLTFIPRQYSRLQGAHASPCLHPRSGGRQCPEVRDYDGTGDTNVQTKCLPNVRYMGLPCHVQRENNLSLLRFQSRVLRSGF